MQFLLQLWAGVVGARSGPLQSGALLWSGPRLDRSRRCAALGADFIPILFCCPPASQSFLPARRGSVPAAGIHAPLCAGDLLRRRGLALRRTWIEQPYGEEEITLLEEEVIPAIQQCLARVDELDERLQAEQELLQSCSMGSPRDALGKLMLQMA